MHLDEDLLQYQIDLKDYRIDKVVGHGSYADVYLAYNKERKPFAAKVALNPLKEEIDQISFQREIRILSQLKHAAFVGFVGFSLKDFNKKKRPVIITEYIPNGSLASVVECFNSEEEEELPLRSRWNDTLALITVYGVASGMAYLHESHIIHRDMKPENVLLDENLYPRITDFGLSKIFEEDSNYQSMQAGTCQYMAPEIIQESNYDISVDVYAYGIIIYEVLTKSFAYNEMPIVQIINRVAYGYRPPIPSSIPTAYKNLIESCWAQNARQRPTFREIVEKIESDESFITETVNKDEFLDYVNYIKNSVKVDMTEKNNGKKNKSRLSLRKTSSLLSSEAKKSLSPENKALLKSADKNDNDACFEVGKYLIDGANGFPKDANNGIQYITKASKNYHIDSLLYLADLYSSTNDVVKQDMTQAKNLYFEASSRGSTKAMVKLGIILQQQNPPDYTGAARLFKKAAILKDGEAMFNYGFLLKNGQGVPKNIDEAVRYYKQSSDAGFPRGMNAYGIALENGWGNNEPDEVEAAKYYSKSAEAGCPGGMRNLGSMYRDGKGVEQNDEIAVRYFAKAAKLGDDDAMMNYGYMLQTGRGVDQDNQKAAKYYKMAASQGNDDAMFHYGLMLINGDGIPKDANNGIQYITKASKNSHIDSLLYLADLYSSTNDIVKQDITQAKNLYSEASSRGSTKAMVKLGIILKQQNPPDYTEAARLFKKASDLKDGEAMLNYGFLLKNGQGVPKNIDEAVRYYKQSSDAGFPRGMNAYGVALENGWGNNEPDEVEAAKYYSKSAEAGCPGGMRNLGFMYRDGKGVEQNDEIAVRYFAKAAKLGDDDAMMNYGYMLQTGRGVDQDNQKAAKYYKMAASQGNDDAMFHYGLMLINGDGIPKDIKRAMKYFKKAMELGNPDAEEYYKFAEKQKISESNKSKDKDGNNDEDSSKRHHHHHKK